MTLCGRVASVAVAALCAAGVGAAPVAAADVVGFTSPSGNVGCILTEDMVRCDIADRSWAPPPRTADCPDFTDYGQGLTLGRTGAPRFVCAGDTALGAGPALPYGEDRAGAGISCRSEMSGMRCLNTDGRGFTLSREDYTVF
ncbi:hypothetical protein MJO55_11290 [Mycolicibacterium rufum]|uniref:Secreted protein n=1 Tax=Mycolicibacterium rufum TaxID=318424 RepID=A0A9X2YF89_9MYCO|nr:DUF6636 domain-containing protein [Mycolicibacterium rufum]KGI67946.1 hypothetical protein EU78_11360 [Mycolicibacterium rufum]MCV7071601.1 hypothetical protein [Mycolicibacterium rufum]ULP38936.1 hypothetical protein MJO55_11290 [Mycolicibacterium rufum]